MLVNIYITVIGRSSGGRGAGIAARTDPRQVCVRKRTSCSTLLTYTGDVAHGYDCANYWLRRSTVTY